jgi:hypothetical protein
VAMDVNERLGCGENRSSDYIFLYLVLRKDPLALSFRGCAILNIFRVAVAFTITPYCRLLALVAHPFLSHRSAPHFFTTRQETSKKHDHVRVNNFAGNNDRAVAQ